MPNKKNYVTYQDIADAVGVTKMTVSKALRNGSDISKKTKLKIIKAAEELGYIPNSSAASLKSGKTKTLAIVFNTFHNLYFSICCHKVFNTIKKYDYSCNLFFCEHSILEIDDVKRLMSYKYSGIISFVEPTKEASDFFEKRGIPFTLVGINSDIPYVDCVYSDDYSGGKQVGEYCIKANCKKPLYVSDSYSETSDRRFSGFKDALAKNEIVPATLPIMRRAPLSELFADTVDEHGIDFVFCFSDALATSLLSYLDNKMIKLNATIVGFDNLHKYSEMISKINSVDNNIDDVINYACLKTIEKVVGTIPLTTHFNKMFDTTLYIYY